MSRLFSDTAYLDAGIPASLNFATNSLAFGCWFRPVTLNNGGDIMGKNAGPNVFYQQYNLVFGSDNKLRFRAAGDHTSTFDEIVGGTVLSAQWYHVLAELNGTGANAMKLFLNGVQDGTGTSNRVMLTDPTFTHNCIGFGVNGSCLGRVADAAIWNAPLTQAEKDLLVKGVSPFFVKRANLKAYWPVYGLGPEVDLFAGITAGVVGAPAYADHAPLPRLFPMAA